MKLDIDVTFELVHVYGKYYLDVPCGNRSKALMLYITNTVSKWRSLLQDPHENYCCVTGVFTYNIYYYYLLL